MRETLTHNRAAEYFNHDGLRTLTGLPTEQWDHAIIKELIDNALDAIDGQDEKKIHIVLNGGALAVYDNGPGIPAEDLDNIFDFQTYVSSKRAFKTPTRGYQGNALKTIIGICYLWGIKLFFLTGGKRFLYVPERTKIEAGIVEFSKQVDSCDSDGNGVLIKTDGCSKIEYHHMYDIITRAIKTYYLANPDVTFIFDDGYDIHTTPAISEPIVRTNKTFIHWYDFAAFNQLLQAVATKDTKRTTKDFCLIFSGSQRVLSKMQFQYKYLTDFAGDTLAVTDLYDELKDLIKEPSSNLLKKQITGKDTLLEIYGNHGEHKYKVITGTYEYNEAHIPYVLEGYLLNSKNEDTNIEIITAINNSTPYDNCPFDFDTGYYGTVYFCGRTHHVNSLKNLLSQSGFMSAPGITLYLNFVSPHVEFTDKSKTRIISRRFRDDLLSLCEYLCKDTIKEVKKSERENRRFNRAQALHEKKEKPVSKIELMNEYFMGAYKIATSNEAMKNTARQMFYKLREIINHETGEVLKISDYNTFTQTVLTKFYNKNPRVEEYILLESRGEFSEPPLSVFGLEPERVPLGTLQVRQFIKQRYSNTARISGGGGMTYSISPELKYNHVLFVEKNLETVLSQTDIVRELNLGIMGTQGFANRAAKKLVKYFLDRGITVYLLHDCDPSGYLIKNNLLEGSDTFKEGLSVIDIGINVADVDRYGKGDLAEVIRPDHNKKREYRVPQAAVDLMTNHEKEFFLVNGSRERFRRVEINAFTTPELVDFLRDKIKYKPIKPTNEQINGFIKLNKNELIKNALFEAFRDRLQDIEPELDTAELAARIRENINGKKHWIETFSTEIRQYEREKEDELIDKIRHLLNGTNP